MDGLSQPTPTVRSGSRRRAWLAAGLAFVAFALALVIMVRNRQPVARRISLTAGYDGTTRALIARALAADLHAHGFALEIVNSESTGDELERVESGAVDFALVSGAFRISAFEHVREVAPLFPEALHLLARQELADQLLVSLRALRGRTVDLGPSDSATAGLASEILEFAEVPCARERAVGTCFVSNLDVDELQRLVSTGDSAALPDAIFHLATVPSTLATELVQTHGYALVALPFAQAFRLGAMIRDSAPRDPGGEVERRYTQELAIPPFTYQIEPPVPQQPSPTVGARLLLVANESVSAATVEEVLEVIFESRFARIPEPPLHRTLLELPPRVPLHRGTIAFIGRSLPWISANDVDRLSNTLSVLGALVGGGLFLWQGWRQRRSARLDELFGKYQLQIAALEGRVVELELSADIALDPLITLQRDLLQLKGEALARYAAGDLGSQATLTDLLVPLNAARDHVGSLLLHVRQNLEQQAETQGRSAEEVWDEAVERSEEPV